MTEKGGGNQTSLGQQSFVSISEYRNKRDVWSVIPSHCKEAHFATFPEELVTPMILAGCPKDGIVLDPFMGSGTTGAVAVLNKRHYIGCELNEAYIEMANRRIADATKAANQITFDDLFEDKQIGLEQTPEDYIERLVSVFREVKRVLKPAGTLWVNIGDSYNNSKVGNTEVIKHKGVVTDSFRKKMWAGAKQKDLIGIPWLLAFALRNDGWYLRQDIIWHKPNPMPESVKDRCTKSHEYIFLLSKSPKYYFDYKAIQEESICKDDRRAGLGHIDYDGKRGG